MSAAPHPLSRPTRHAARRALAAICVVAGATIVSTSEAVAVETSPNNVEKSGVATSPAGSTTETVAGTIVDWTLEYTTDDDGLSRTVEVVDTRSANMEFVDGSFVAPPNWDVVENGSSVAFSQTNVVGQGYTTSVPMPSDVALAGGQGNGDGFVPLFGSDGRIYFTYHHRAGTIQCIDPETGICPDYAAGELAMTLPSVDAATPPRMWTPNAADGSTVIGTYLYQAGRLTSGQYGLGCWDLIARTECADKPFIETSTVSANQPSTFDTFAQGPYVIGGNMYVWDTHQDVDCITIATWASCGTTSMLDAATFPEVTRDGYGVGEVLDGKLYFGWSFNNSLETGVTLGGTRIRCFDPAIPGECAGWNGSALVQTSGNNLFDLFVSYDTDEAPVGICGFARNGSPSVPGCVSLDDGSAITTLGTTNGLPTALSTWMLANNGVATAQYSPNEPWSMFSTFPTSGIKCWDWVEEDWCAGFGTDGLLTDGATVTRDYGARYNPATGCWWSLGDPNILWSFDEDGNVPCVPSITTLSDSATFVSSFCRTGTPSDLTWEQSRVFDFDASQWNSFVVTVSLEDGTLVGSYDAVTDGVTFDLSSVDASLHDTLDFEVSAVVKSGEDPFASEDTTPTVSMEYATANPIEFCYQTITTGDPCIDSNVATNIVEVSDADGDLIETDADSFTILPTSGVCPSIVLDKTVYSGHDSGVGCPGVESEYVLPSSDVTWCFVVTNDGDVNLASIEITDPDLPASPIAVPAIAAGASATVFAKGTSGLVDLLNTATVTGTAVDSDGTPVPGAPTPTDDDQAEYLVAEPAITLAKTLYSRHDGGSSCATAVEVLYLEDDTDVTWCFSVTNSGDIDLIDVTISDATLTIADLAVGDIDQGDTVVVSFEGTGTADLINTATATGTPADPDGDAITTLPEPTDDDTAEIDLVSPSITIEKTVSTDGSCPGVELATVEAGIGVIWCFAVTNNGDTDLADVTITDTDLAITLNLGAIDAGDSTNAQHVGTASVDVVNIASVTGTPIDENDVPLDGITPPTDSDDAEIDVIAPDITIEKTVSLDGSCPGVDLVKVEAATPVTWCFTVTNSGDTVLTDVTLSDPLLFGAVLQDVAASMQVGEIVTFSEPGLATDDVTNTGTVTGVPSTTDGTPIDGISAPVDEDDASVDVVSPSIALAKTVSTDGNCPGVETVTVEINTPVTWCFTVTNTGDTDLGDVTVTDALIGVAEDLGTLAASASTSFQVAGTATADLTNTADVIGTPVDGAGDVIPNLDQPTDTNMASIDVIGPGLTVVKTVSVDGMCPGSDLEHVEADTPILWCFTVRNTGDTVLTDVHLDDPLAGIDPTVLGQPFVVTTRLDPGASFDYEIAAVATGDLTNVVTASGTPSFVDGSPIPGITPPESTDTADIVIVDADITVAKTVSTSGSCPGVETVIVEASTAVTWCFTVTNTGDTHLVDVMLGDATIGLDPFVASPLLAPGESVSLSEPGVATDDLVNTVDVSGVASNETGTPYPGVSDPTASDDAAIEVVGPDIAIAKTVSMTGSCPGVETATVAAGTDITWCIEVANTGDTHLTNVTITDVLVGVDDNIGTLAPLDTFYLAVVGTATGDLTNTAGVTGIPSDPAGVPIDGLTSPTADDEAEVDVVAPGIAVAKTVSADGNCPGVEQLTVEAGTAITWCFAVTNTGDTVLTNVVLDDPRAGLDSVVVAPSLQPGATATYDVDGVRNSDLLNTADVTGTPAYPNGDPIDGLTSPTADDEAEVDVVAPGIAVAKTVSADGNCPGVEQLTVEAGTAIKWCFAVTNTGDTHLSDVIIFDPALAGAYPVASSMAPGAVVLHQVEGVASSLLNSATASGVPSTAGGTPLSDVIVVEDTDTARVSETDAAGGGGTNEEVDSPTGPGPDLPATGSRSIGLINIAAMFVVLGLLIALATRRRGHPDTYRLAR